MSYKTLAYILTSGAVTDPALLATNLADIADDKDLNLNDDERQCLRQIVEQMRVIISA